MAQNYKSTGTKISQYPFAEINTTNYKNKFQHNHYFISYANTNYGIAGIRKNFQLSLEALREDMIGYIGINNAKAGWRDYIVFWEGDWYNDDRLRSYVTPFYLNESHYIDYVPYKYGLDKQYDSERSIHRVYLLNTAPLPLEATDKHFTSKIERNYGEDLNPHGVKLVSKQYVDDRHAGFRNIDVQDYQTTDSGCPYKENVSHLSIRPSTCFYQYTDSSKLSYDEIIIDDVSLKEYYIDIYDDCILEDGSTFEDKVKHNRLTFFLRIKNNPEFYTQQGKHGNFFKLKVKGLDNVVKYSYEDEWTEILREHRTKIIDGVIANKEKEYIFLKCEVEYIGGKYLNTGQWESGIFTMTCSNFWGRKKHIKRMVELPVLNENGVIDVDLSLHENENFVFNVPDDSTPTDNKRSQITINLDVSKLDDYHMYSWDFFMFTGDDKLVHNNTNTLDSPYFDFCEVVFGKTSILWANQDNFNITPNFQPNKMYCIEFVKAFDGVLIGRIKYYVTLIKKS